MGKPPFDFERSAFYLFAAVIAAYLIIAMAGVTACLIYTSDIVEGKWVCDKGNRLTDLLSTALSAVLGYIAGRFKSEKPP